jgi:hypothetical protein
LIGNGISNRFFASYYFKREMDQVYDMRLSAATTVAIGISIDQSIVFQSEHALETITLFIAKQHCITEKDPLTHNRFRVCTH